MPRGREPQQGRDLRAGGKERSRETSEGCSGVFLTFSMDTCPLYNQTTKRDPAADSHVGAVPGAQGGPETGQQVGKVVQAMSQESGGAGVGDGEAPGMFLESDHQEKQNVTPLGEDRNRTMKHKTTKKGKSTAPLSQHPNDLC